MARPRAAHVVTTLLVVVVAVVAVGIWMALGAVTAYERLSSAREGISALQTDVTQGDLTDLDAHVVAVRQDTAEARDAVDTWAWKLSEHAPGIGDDVIALRTVVGVTDDLAQGPVDDLARAASRLTVESLKPVRGRVPLDPLRDVAPDVAAGKDGLLAAQRDLRGVDTTDVLAGIGRAVAQLQDQVDDLAGRVVLADRMVTLLPPMLGGEEKRRYLLLNQNNAEARSLGGIVGSAIAMTAENGRVRLRQQIAGNTLGALEDPVLALTPAEQSLYGTGLGRYFLNATNTPDFPRAAQLAAARWELEKGQELDGVLSVDPGTLALLLRATGPVDVGGVELTADNAQDLLLSDVYAQLPDPQAQDAFFAAAAEQVFERLASGRADVRVAAESLVEATEQGRFLVWASRRAEQQALSGSTIAGELDGTAGDIPELGVYRFETTASKLSYYQDVAITSRPTCADGRVDGDAAVRVELTSQVPRSRGARDALPDYVAAGGSPRGTMATRVLLYAPPGALFDDVRVDGKPQGTLSVLHEDLFVVGVDLRIRPGSTRTIATRLKNVAAAGDGSSALAVRTTPTARQGQFSLSTMECR